MLPRLIPAAMLLIAAPLAFACDYPNRPEIPEGSTASKEEMVAASRAIKAYQNSMVQYRDCLDEESTAKLIELEIGKADEEEVNNYKLATTKKYNASVDEEELVVARFNESVRAYKAQAQ